MKQVRLFAPFGSLLLGVFIFTALLLLSPRISHAGENTNWPDFRGPNADGHSDATGLPLTWSEEENIVWKTPIHDEGYSTPVVWGDQIWLTTATEDGKTLYAVCVDVNSGAIVHDIEVFHPEKVQPKNANNSYATPSAVVEEGRVYVHYGLHGTAALDTKTGEKLWERTDFHCDHMQGPVASPFLYKDLLFVHFEGGEIQYFVALNKHTGELVYRVDRPRELYEHLDPLYLCKAYQTPVVVEVDGQPQLLSNAAVLVTAHEPLTGKELWRVRYRDDSPVSRIVSGHGLHFVNTGGSPGAAHLMAIREGGVGDVTDTHVVWELTEDMPLLSSPVLVEELLYTISDKGVMMCLEAKTGETVWTKRFRGDFGASLLYADNKIYIVSRREKTFVIAPGREFKELAVNKLDGTFGASPVVTGKSLLLRSTTHLYRIEENGDAS